LPLVLLRKNEAGDNTQRLSIAFKSTMVGHALMQYPFARMTKRRIADVMRKTCRFN